LHFVYDPQMVKSIVFHLHPEKLPLLLMSEDNTGNTPILLLAFSGNFNALKVLLDHIDDQCDLETMSLCLQKQNKLKQNILHLAALSPCLDQLHHVLIEYLYSVDISNMMYPDVNGNTPLHYVAAKYSTKTFADFMLHLPLTLRKYVADCPNQQKTTCHSIIARPRFDTRYYVDKVLGGDTASLAETSNATSSFGIFATTLKHLVCPVPYAYNEDIFKVLQHTLNQYLLPCISVHDETTKLLPAAAAARTEPGKCFQKKGKVSLNNFKQFCHQLFFDRH